MRSTHTHARAPNGRTHARALNERTRRTRATRAGVCRAMRRHRWCCAPVGQTPGSGVHHRRRHFSTRIRARIRHEGYIFPDQGAKCVGAISRQEGRRGVRVGNAGLGACSFAIAMTRWQAMTVDADAFFFMNDTRARRERWCSTRACDCVVQAGVSSAQRECVSRLTESFGVFFV